MKRSTPQKAAHSHATGPQLESFPGHQIRRLQQIAVAILLQETDSFGVTPVQCAAMIAANNENGIDQKTLARTIGLDTSTIAGVIDRLEARNLLRRDMSAQDARVRLISITDKGRALLETITPLLLRAQTRILAPLTRTEQVEFIRMLRKLVSSNNEFSRAPSKCESL